MTPFRWNNCFADVLTSKHDLTIQSYLDDVIMPALEAHLAKQRTERAWLPQAGSDGN